MWDEMMTRGTQAHDDYAHWIARLSRIGKDLSDFWRNTQWMLSAYFEGLPSCKRENAIRGRGWLSGAETWRRWASGERTSGAPRTCCWTPSSTAGRKTPRLPSGPGGRKTGKTDNDFSKQSVFIRSVFNFSAFFRGKTAKSRAD